MDFIVEIIKLLVGGGVITGIAIYLGKHIISKGTDVLMDNHKNQLEILKNEHQIRFSSLHNERAQLIKKLNHSLYDLEKKLRKVTSLAQGPEWSKERIREDEAIAKYQETLDLLEENRIYIPDSLCEQIFKTLEDYNDIVFQMIRAKNKAKYEETSFRFPEGEGSLDLWLNAEKKVQKEIKEARFELVKEFRKIIGEY